MSRFSANSGIIVDHDAINQINDIFKTVKSDRSFNVFILYAMDNTYIWITYECDFKNIFKISHNHVNFRRISVPPTRLGLSKNDIEILWEGLELLEKEGWQYDTILEDGYYDHYVYDFPAPEERQKLLDLLKKVYSFPLTKACK